MHATLDRSRLLLLAAALALAALGLVTGPVRGATHAVAIADFAFSPATLTITAGDTVVWTNEDTMIHTATSTSGLFDSGDLDQGESYSLTFTTPGTYDYLCTPHPNMTGRIVVVAAAATPAPAASDDGLPNVAVPAHREGGRLLILAGALLLAIAALTWPLLRGGRARGATVTVEAEAEPTSQEAARSSRHTRPDG